MGEMHTFTVHEKFLVDILLMMSHGLESKMLQLFSSIMTQRML